MKVVFCSNYMNHHQLYFSLAMINQGVDYTFIASEKIEKDRLENGWVDMNTQYNWILRIYDGKKEEKKAKELIMNADIVINGSFPIKYLRKRIFSNKPVFLYSERIFRNESGDMEEFKTLHNFLSNLLHRKYFNYFNVYLLCASAYTAYDYSIYHNFKDRCYKWGYFPYVIKHDISKLIELKRKNNKINILWVARFMQLKHPEYPIYLANRLKKEGYEFELNMIGVGELYDKIQNNINSLNLNNEVHLLGSMPTEKVREYMNHANIFLFTSDYREGWGAVMNESMNSACCIVANHAIGSVPFLIQDGINGFMYTNGNKDEFYKLVKQVIDNKELRENVSIEAYKTLVNEWNPENAAKKLLMLYDKLINKKDIDIPNGVCSKAEILDNKWRE